MREPLKKASDLRGMVGVGADDQGNGKLDGPFCYPGTGMGLTTNGKTGRVHFKCHSFCPHTFKQGLDQVQVAAI